MFVYSRQASIEVVQSESLSSKPQAPTQGALYHTPKNYRPTLPSSQKAPAEATAKGTSVLDMGGNAISEKLPFAMTQRPAGRQRSSTCDTEYAITREPKAKHK